ncbi:MAG: porin [Gammaproteobacteria bacterium]
MSDSDFQQPTGVNVILKRHTAALSAVLMAVALPLHAAGITVYKGDNGEYVKLGGRIQIQYHRDDPDSGSSTDEVFFRRLRPYVEGSLYPDWKGKIQIDFGKADGDHEVAIEDAYMQYKGHENMKVTFGNVKFPFSRESLTSSKKQQLVERTFVGDHNYGTPDRNIGLHLTGQSKGKRITWGASATSASIDPDNKKLDFDTPVNRNDDFNEGWMFGGRVDFHPFGKLKFAQGDFKGETKATIGVAAFSWKNDDDNNTYDPGCTKKCDVDSVTGYEISGAFRSNGFSVDAEYNMFDTELTESGVTNGIYRNGQSDLKNWSIEGGYMVISNKLEIVAGYSSQDADNYATEWTRTSLGANYFIKKHDIKIQATWRINEDENGVTGRDANEFFLQTQYVF